MTTTLTARQIANREKKRDKEDTFADHMAGMHFGIDVTDECVSCREFGPRAPFFGTAVGTAEADQRGAWFADQNRERVRLTAELHSSIATLEGGLS